MEKKKKLKPRETVPVCPIADPELESSVLQPLISVLFCCLDIGIILARGKTVLNDWGKVSAGC